MTLVVWPEDLPQAFLASGYGDAAPNNLIIDEYNVGPPSYRRRTTSAPAPFMGEMFLTTEEWETLSTFFHTTLIDGVMRFLFPTQGVTNDSFFWISRFVSPPMRRMSDVDDGWFVALSMERLGVGEAFLITPLFSETDSLYAPSISIGSTVPVPLLTEAGGQILTEAGDDLEAEN